MANKKTLGVILAALVLVALSSCRPKPTMAQGLDNGTVGAQF